MDNMDWDLLEKLCAIHAVSGREDAMTAFVSDQIASLTDESYVDNLGNVVGVLRGAQFPDYKLMLQAHMDELGLIIRNIDDNGFLFIERIGGIPEKTLLGQKVDILTDTGRIVTGYIGAKSHHVTTLEEKYKVPNVHELFVDVGVNSRQAVNEMGIQVGDPITYHPNFSRFGDGVVCSKALDNRASVFILLETLKSFSINRPPSTLVFSFTVLEEFSMHGSLPTVRTTKPDAIISLDITVACDTPVDKPLQPVMLRHGPAIKMMDFHGRGTLAGLFSSPKLRRFIESVANDIGISLQREVIVGVITDPAFQLYLDDKGYTIAGISIPQRYTHFPTQICHEVDMLQTFQLVCALVKAFTPQIDLRRG